MTQELTTKKQSPLSELRRTMEAPEMRMQIKMALPPHIPVDKFIRVVTTAVSNEPKLLNANRATLYNACMKAAADGLVPDGKEAALVAYGDEVVYLPMVGGILKKVRNSGELDSICSLVVHKNENFKLWVDNEGEHFSHEPMVFGDKGEPIGVYAHAKTKDGGVYFEVMSKEQVMDVRNVAKTKAIWDGKFGLEKWKVACIRRLSKRLPMSTDLEATIQNIDEDTDFDLDKQENPAPMTAPTNTSSRLNAAVAAKTTPAPMPAPQPKPAAPPMASPAAPPAPAAAQEPNEDPNVDDLHQEELPI